VAELGVLGIPRSTLRGQHWRRTTRGCYVPAGAGEYDGSPTGLQRILEAVPLLPPEGALTGWPSAYLAAVAGVDGLDSASMAELPVPICLVRSTHRGEAQGVRYLCDQLVETERRPVRLRIHDVFLDEETVVALPTTTPERAVFDEVRLAPDLSAAVAFLDMAANAGWTALSAFEAYLSTRRGARRVRFVRQALELADSAAPESLGEQAARVLRHGRPAPSPARQRADLQP
jgi:hypothetical protein